MTLLTDHEKIFQRADVDLVHLANTLSPPARSSKGRLCRTMSRSGNHVVRRRTNADTVDRDNITRIVANSSPCAGSSGTANQRIQVRLWYLAKGSILLTFAADIFFETLLDIYGQSAQHSNNDPVAAYHKGSFKRTPAAPSPAQLGASLPYYGCSIRL
jgi:hypothetical protein